MQAHTLSPKPNPFFLTAWHCLSDSLLGKWKTLMWQPLATKPTLLNAILVIIPYKLSGTSPMVWQVLFFCFVLFVVVFPLWCPFFG